MDFIYIEIDYPDRLLFSGCPQKMYTLKKIYIFLNKYLAAFKTLNIKYSISGAEMTH